ncbi:MAG: hypothetical protein KC425_13040, partial [Anaerolineales bacterium]|nr:hypothetical protein [Anaerolineales bacterium]
LMRMDPGLDTGPMFVQRAIPIRPRETAASLHDRLAALGGALLRDSLPGILAGDIRPQPQDDAQSTYAPMIQKEAGQLDWSETAAALDRRIRAMTPWPGAFTTWNGQHFKILAAHPADFALPAGPPGQVLALETVADTGAETVSAVVLTGSGGLVLDQVQLAGKRAADTADFLRGRPDLPGSILGAT